MNERLTILNHNGKKILLLNLSGLKEPDILKLQDEAKNLILKEKIRLLILDIKDTTTTKTIKEKSIEITKEADAKLGKTYSALLGLRLSQQIIANLINKDAYFARNIEDAKEKLSKKI